MRILAYFAGWLLALPGLLFAAALLALHRLLTVGNLAAIAWEAIFAFAYGVPLAGLIALVLCILGFFRMGRLIGAGALLVAALGTVAILLESTGAPKGFDQAFFLAPTGAAALLAGWLLRAEANAAPPPAPSAPTQR
ncbi:MAG: hypothetical protein ABIX11_11805 [Casimicrobiaceae bacterium]